MPRAVHEAGTRVPSGDWSVCSDGEARLSCSDGEFLVLDHPHRREASWQAVVADARWQATLDFFDYGIAVANPHLSKQHFILR